MENVPMTVNRISDCENLYTHLYTRNNYRIHIQDVLEFPSIHLSFDCGIDFSQNYSKALLLKIKVDDPGTLQASECYSTT